MGRKKDKQNYSERVTIRYTEIELKQLEKCVENSTCQTISEYIRNLSLKKPITVYYRNQSADDYLSEMILLKNELSAIGRNINQAVHKLHTLDRFPEINRWLSIHDPSNTVLFSKVQEIREKMIQIHTLWSQE